MRPSLLALSLTALPALARGKVVERIVAVVNDDIVLLSDVEERARPFLGEIEAQPADREQALSRVMRDTLERIIDERLVAHEAQKLQLAVTAEEIDRAVDDIKRQNKITHEQLLDALRSSGMTYDEYRSDLNRQILRLKVLNIQVRSRINVSDDDVRRYYDQNLRRAGADVRIRLHQIFVQIPETAPRAIVREGRKRAERIAERVRAGENFAQIARLESDDLLSRADGGDIGWVGRGVLPPEVEEVVFTMAVGELRGPIYSDRGAYLVRVVERKASAARPFEEIKEELRAQIAQEEIERATKTWLVEVRRRSYVDIRYQVTH